MVIAGVVLPYTVIFGVMGAWLLAALCIPLAAAYGLVPVLNARGHRMLASFTLVVAGNAAVAFYAAVLGPAAKISMIFGVLVVEPFIVFRHRDRTAITAALTIPFVLYTLLSLGALDFVPHTQLPDGVLHILGLAMAPTSFALTLAAVVTLAVENHRYESKLARLVTTLEHQVDKRRQAVALATDREEQLNAILDNTVDGIVSLDSRREIRSYNVAAEKLFGWVARDAIGADMTMIIPRSAAALVEAHGSDVECEVRARRRSGEEFPMGMTVSAYESAGERLHVAVLRDLTARKAADEELERSHRRMADLAHQAGMAEIAASVLHNVGNALTSVSVSVTVLREHLSGFRAGRLKGVASQLEAMGTALTPPSPQLAKIASYLEKFDDALERRSV